MKIMQHFTLESIITASHQHLLDHCRSIPEMESYFKKYLMEMLGASESEASLVAQIHSAAILIEPHMIQYCMFFLWYYIKEVAPVGGGEGRFDVNWPEGQMS
jgi:hypothetical protein